MRSAATGVVADPGRREAGWIVRVGLLGGVLLLLAASSVYLAGALDMLPATLAAVWSGPAVTSLALAAVAVLGTILVSIGAVFKLLESTGILAAATPSHRGVEETERPRGPAASESRRGASSPVRGRPGQEGAPSDQRREPNGAGDVEPGALPSRGATPDGRPKASTAGAPDRHAPSLGPSRSGEVSQADAHGPVAGNAATPAHEAQPSEARTPGGAHDIEEPPPPEPPQPGDLIAAWDDYRRNGDGHFSRRGLQEVLRQWGFDADVRDGDRVGAGGAVLVVETFGTRNFCVLPSFNKSPRAVADWFDDHSGGALTGRTQRLARVARGRWVEPGTGNGKRFEVLERGEVA